MEIRQLFILLFLSVSVVTYSQEFSAGAGLNISTMSMNTTSKEFYFADDASSNYKVEQSDQSDVKTFLAPSLYLLYFINDNYYLDGSLSYSLFIRSFDINFSDRFNQNSTGVYKYNYQIMHSSLMIGRRFLRTKPLRVNLGIGVEYSNLLSVKEQRLRQDPLLLKNI